MKRRFRILFGCIIITGLLLISTDSCIKPNPEGWCFIDCICGSCGFSYGESLTKKECQDRTAQETADSQCDCPCTYTWED